MNTPKTTAKDFFLWAGAVVSFYWAVVAYAALLYDYINYSFPNALSYYPVNPYESGISFEMSSVIILLPIYLIVMWLIHREVAVDASKNEIWVRRWALIFTLFIAALFMTGDLIFLLNQFLSGVELTTAFLLKAGVIFALSLGVFLHFIADLKGYWDRFPTRRTLVRVAVGILAAGSIVAGFFIVGTPADARRARFDSERVTDLQDIQYRIATYYSAKQTLPGSITDLANSLSYGDLPTDPETKAPYRYNATGATSFKLCATFARPTPYAARTSPISFRAVNTTDASSWQHAAGDVCFERTIDPSFYPPISPTR